MNIFRLAGDISHLLAIIILLLKIWTSRSCAGISGKSQVMFAITYTARYLDLLTNFISLYNSTMKVIFLAASYATLYLIYMRFKATYDHNHDTFRVEFLLIPTVILSVLINHDFSPLEILWTFSIYLESVAILPQLFMVSKTGEAESITSHYLFALGSYRALYIVNWSCKERSFNYQPKTEVFVSVTASLQPTVGATNTLATSLTVSSGLPICWLE
ncbi:ER lumen protein-retaining receptor 1-B [Portunus trituberculatus]|uniref:ER lumen protein-retaining receptor n=1 Tax=Portunus trituberculatus TaxID=210409 RepID=A0A5B7EZ20_PORTR|nr:ER lumen protein-retaining receptor 1-B [Portunus trituberculatus]